MPKNNLNLLFIFIICLKICLNAKKSLVIPYTIYKPRITDKTTKEQIYQLLERNYFYSIFQIGNPTKTIPIFYTFNTSNIFFRSDSYFSDISELSYNPSKSKSFKTLQSKIAQEDLSIHGKNGLVIKNLSFLNEEPTDTNLKYYAYIGLQNFYKENLKKKVKNPNFLYQLKRLGLIDNISFSINQTSENEGFININLEPDEYSPDLYSNKTGFKYRKWNRGVDSKMLDESCGDHLWNLEISYAYYKNKKGKMVKLDIDHYVLEEDQYSIILNPAYGLIQGPYDYKKEMEKDYFGEFIKSNICSISRVNNLVFYSCDANYKKKLKTNFPPVNFYDERLNYTFVLDFDDLFYEENGILFFLICYDSNIWGTDKFTKISEWVFGKPFFDKYQFSFEVETNNFIFYVNKKGYKPKNYKKLRFVNKTDKEYIHLYNQNFFNEKILPIKNLIFIALSLFIIFVSFFCISYNLRSSAIKNKDKNTDVRPNDELELKEKLDSENNN